jgi:hypothetical protein
MSANIVYVSLGYRCSSAGILKRLGLKTESYPFDWMVSRLPIIAHCVKTGFHYLIDPQNYITKHTHTTHFHEGTTPVPLRICREIVHVNQYYETAVPEIRQYVSASIPQPLSVANGDTYASLCVINHRNILETETQTYYHRCVARWQALSTEALNATEALKATEALNATEALTATTPQTIVGLYIHPAITEQEYAEQKDALIREFEEFRQTTVPHWTTVLFFMMVRTENPYPITKYREDCLETLVDTPETNILTVYTNRDFVDAGEIFYQNAYIETDRMCQYIGSRFKQI